MPHRAGFDPYYYDVSTLIVSAPLWYCPPPVSGWGKLQAIAYGHARLSTPAEVTRDRLTEVIT